MATSPQPITPEVIFGDPPTPSQPSPMGTSEVPKVSHGRGCVPPAVMGGCHCVLGGGGRSRPVLVAAVEDHEGVGFAKEILLVQLVGTELQCGYVLRWGRGVSLAPHPPQTSGVQDPGWVLLSAGVELRDPGPMGHTVGTGQP